MDWFLLGSKLIQIGSLVSFCILITAGRMLLQKDQKKLLTARLRRAVYRDILPLLMTCFCT
ncbi:unnamed protein product, partial [Ilex paraguariensis]